MRYYFSYKVTFIDRNGKTGSLIMRADNPTHLVRRFKEKYPSRSIYKFISCDEKRR